MSGRIADVPKNSKRELYEWGRGCKINEQPKLLPGKEVHTISCGGSHSAALLNDGTVYVWGDGRSGQLGLGSGIKKTDTPTQVTTLAEERVVGVWCGFAQTAAFTASGTLYTWGFDCFCGPVYEPKVVEKYRNAHVNEVAFGPSMAIALMINKATFPHASSNGSKTLSEIMVWGIADKGALGLGENVREQREPVSIPQLSGRGIVKVSVGEFHAAAVTNRCEVFVWGLNEHETLGTFCGGIIWSPKPVLKLEFINVSNIVCGTNCTFAMSSDGDVFSWGKGRHGVLGHGDEEDQQFPLKIESLQSVVGIASGGMHVVAWMEDGSVCTWGWGRDYKLGHQHDNDLFEPTHVEGTKGKFVLQVACGFDRTLALLETDLITVTYRDEVKTLPIYADTRVSNVIQQLSEHLQITTPVVLIDNNGQELNVTEKMRICVKVSNKFFLIQKPSLWDEADEDLLFEGSPDPTGNTVPDISKATVNKLILWLTHHTGTDQYFSKIFLLMYPNFLAPEEFLEKLIDRYTRPRLPQFLHESMAKDARRIIQLRVVNVLRKWIQGSYLDIMHERDVRLVEAIRVFIETDIQVEQPREAVFLRRFLTGKLGSGGNLSKSRSHTVNYNVDAPKTMKPDHPREIDLFKYPALEVARQLAIIGHFYFFRKIHPNEFVNLAWSKKDKQEKAPNIVSCILRFNNLSEWCAAEILRGETHQVRVEKTERLIEIASECLKLRNLSAVVAIISSLGSAPIFRLRIWSIYLQDLTFLSDANPDKDPNNPKLINFSKWNKLGSIVEKLVRIQESPYNLRPIFPLMNYLLSACGFENHENAAYKYSELIEPRDPRQTPRQIIIPSLVSKTVQNLYIYDKPKRPLLEEPEIQLLNQRSKLILQNFQLSLEPDRFSFWKTLVEKLAASSSRRHIVSHYQSLKDLSKAKLVVNTIDIDCLSFREVLVKSCVIECSIESVLILFPTETNHLELFTSLLKATLRSYLDVDKLVLILRELSECRLVREYRSIIVDLISCYKDIEVQARHNRISASVRALSRLQSKRKDFIKANENVPPVEAIMNELSFSAEGIQNMYVQQQLLREKKLEYGAIFTKYNESALTNLCEFLEDSTRNINLRIALKEQQKKDLTTQFETRMEEMKKQRKQEENCLELLQQEEQEILKELADIEKKVIKSSRGLQTFNFFCENAAVRVDAEKKDFVTKQLPRRSFIENYGSCTTALHTLSEVFVAQFKQKLAAEVTQVETQVERTENIKNFLIQQLSGQKSLNQFLQETQEDEIRRKLIADDFMLYCDYQAKILHFVPFLCYLLDFCQEVRIDISRLMDAQQECLMLIRKK